MSSSPVLATAEEHDHSSPERKLWIAVIWRAIDDFRDLKTSHTIEYKDDLIAFFFDGGLDSVIDCCNFDERLRIGIKRQISAIAEENSVGLTREERRNKCVLCEQIYPDGVTCADGRVKNVCQRCYAASQEHVTKRKQRKFIELVFKFRSYERAAYEMKVCGKTLMQWFYGTQAATMSEILLELGLKPQHILTFKRNRKQNRNRTSTKALTVNSAKDNRRGRR